MGQAFYSSAWCCSSPLYLSVTQTTIQTSARPLAKKALPDASFADLSNPFQRALFSDVMNIFYPGQYDKNSAIASTLTNAQEKSFHDKLQNSNVKEHLTGEKWLQISGMYIKFIIVYVHRHAAYLLRSANARGLAVLPEKKAGRH